MPIAAGCTKQADEPARHRDLLKAAAAKDARRWLALEERAAY